MLPNKNIQNSSLNELTSIKNNALKNGELHLAYKKELEFYELVKNGNIEELEKNKPQLIVKGQGILSDDKFRNIQYHFVVATALIVRFCIEGGLSAENAYTMSDVFIRRMDNLWEQEEVEQLHYEMVLTFAKMMRNLKKSVATSIYVRKAIDYITSHYNLPIKIPEIAKALGLSEKYLSSLFKKETGSTLVSYIEHIRVEEARRILSYTNLSYSEIADQLSFNSHSYFAKVFKKHTGFTPMEYRIKYQPQNFLTQELSKN